MGSPHVVHATLVHREDQETCRPLTQGAGGLHMQIYVPCTKWASVKAVVPLAAVMAAPVPLHCWCSGQPSRTWVVSPEPAVHNRHGA